MGIVRFRAINYSLGVRHTVCPAEANPPGFVECHISSSQKQEGWHLSFCLCNLYFVCAQWWLSASFRLFMSTMIYNMSLDNLARLVFISKPRSVLRYFRQAHMGRNMELSDLTSMHAKELFILFALNPFEFPASAVLSTHIADCLMLSQRGLVAAAAKRACSSSGLLFQERKTELFAFFDSYRAGMTKFETPRTPRYAMS